MSYLRLCMKQTPTEYARTAKIKLDLKTPLLVRILSLNPDGTLLKTPCGTIANTLISNLPKPNTYQCGYQFGLYTAVKMTPLMCSIS